MVFALMSKKSPSIRYVFHNLISSERDAFQVLHLLKHLHSVAFQWTLIRDDLFFPLNLAPAVAELLPPIHIRELWIYFFPPSHGIPTIEHIERIYKFEKFVWKTRPEPIHANEVELFLGQYAVVRAGESP